MHETSKLLNSNSSPEVHIDINESNKSVKAINVDDDDCLPLPSKNTFIIMHLSVLIACLLYVFFATLFSLIFHDPNPILQIDSISVPTFNISSPKIYFNSNISLSMINPNNHTAYFYSNMSVLLFYKKEPLFVGTIKPFYHQRELEKISFHTSLTPIPTLMLDRTVSALKSYVTSLKPLPLQVEVKSQIIADPQLAEMMHEPMHRMTSKCDDVKIVFPSASSSGSMLKAPLQCKVKIQDQEVDQK